MSDTVRQVRALVDQIGDDERLDAVSKPLAAIAERITARDDVKRLLSGSWLGHRLHPLLTDIPIGTWTSATILDLLGGSAGRRAARRLVGVGILASIPTAAAGLSDWHDSHGAEQRIGVVHAAANSTTLVLQIMSWRARGKGHWLRGAALSAMGVATTVVGGYLGGHLVFVQRVGVDRAVPAPGVATWRVVCRADDVPDLRPIGVTVDDAKLVIVRRGPIVDAMAAVCSHAGGPLDEGTVTDSGLRCPWHGSVFALEDGRVLRGPATAPQPIYEARINDGMVEIRGPIDESALAGDDVIRLTDGSALHQV